MEIAGSYAVVDPFSTGSAQCQRFLHGTIVFGLAGPVVGAVAGDSFLPASSRIVPYLSDRGGRIQTEDWRGHRNLWCIGSSYFDC